MPPGTLHAPKRMEAWQAYWREDGHLAAVGFRDTESGPHRTPLTLHQRVVVTPRTEAVGARRIHVVGC